MSFVLPDLPYARDALAPHISAETIDFHYGKHHAAYVSKLNSLASGNPVLGNVTLDEIVAKGKDGAFGPAGVYNSAAQTWNHTFYWKSLSPTPTEPSPRLLALITQSFGSLDKFKTDFSNVAAGHFGSGWAWLVQDKATGLLKITETHDAVSALSGKEEDSSVKPILTCDVWEHAYYIDFRNARPKYIEAWWKLVNWTFADQNLIEGTGSKI